MEPWRASLAKGDVGAAWDLFIGRYRRLILATTRRLTEGDDAADAFTYVCEALAADGLARLTRYERDRPGGARFPTWLVTVVHHLVIDWRRAGHGRRRVRPPDALSDVQRRIFVCVFVEGRSHAETYEIVQASTPEGLTFSAFLKELAQTYRVVERTRPRGALHYLRGPALPGAPEGNGEDRVVEADAAARLAAAVESLPPAERAAIRLFVVEGVPAADVARVVGWPNAKAVYNRVYRSLTVLRKKFEREGIGAADL